jgi:hypothetical protein
MLKWDPDEFKKKLISDLAENGEIVGKFVENDARQRLLAIKDPKWGEAYRNRYVARLLSYEVIVKPKEVVINVGVRPSSTSRRHGFYIEIGTKKWPAHPFLRPAVFMNAAKIVALLAGK